MRREEYEFQVTRPQVIMREIDGQLMEPYEELSVDVDEQFQAWSSKNWASSRACCSTCRWTRK
jgi:predicted membrane GTPase involved in stress response